MNNPADIERALVGAMVIEESVIAEVATILKPSDFYSRSCELAFECIVGLFNQRQTVDLLTVTKELDARKIINPSASDLAQWADAALPFHAVAHAETVKKFADARAMIRLCQDALEELANLADEPRRIGDHLATKLLLVGTGGRKQFVSLTDATVGVLKAIEKSAGSQDALEAVPTGLTIVDRKIGGLYRGQLIIIAGRPSMGKTALAMTIVKGAAARGCLCAVVSCESPTNSIILRLLAAETGIENRDLRRGQLDDLDYPRIASAASRLSPLPVYLYDRERSWETIKAALRAFKIQQAELGLVVLDYVQLLQLRSREDRWQQIGQISSEAKELALELDVPFVLLSQITREVDKRPDKRPSMSDLRESGNLEQDADLIGFLFRPHYYDADEPADEAEFIIAKNRDGATGTIDLKFNERTASFADPTAAAEQASFLYG